MYSDDLIGITFLRVVEHDLLVALALCTALLGPTTVANDETEMGTQLIVIGWDIDLKKLLVAISRSIV